MAISKGKTTSSLNYNGPLTILADVYLAAMFVFVAEPFTSLVPVSIIVVLLNCAICRENPNDYC